MFFCTKERNNRPENNWLEGSFVDKEVLVGNNMNSTLGCISKSVASRSRALILSSFDQHLIDPIKGALSSFKHPNRGKTQMGWRLTEMVRGVAHVM